MQEHVVTAFLKRPLLTARQHATEKHNFLETTSGIISMLRLCFFNLPHPSTRVSIGSMPYQPTILLVNKWPIYEYTCMTQNIGWVRDQRLKTTPYKYPLDSRLLQTRAKTSFFAVSRQLESEKREKQRSGVMSILVIMLHSVAASHMFSHGKDPLCTKPCKAQIFPKTKRTTDTSDKMVRRIQLVLLHKK